MALNKQLGFGRTGWHGQESVSHRSALNTAGMATLLNELATDHNAALAKLDTDNTVTDTDYASKLSVSAALMPNASSAHVHQGGSYSHGDDAARLKRTTGVAGLHELKTKHNALLVKLDADTGVTDNNYVDAARTVAAFSAHAGDLGQGGSSTHGDGAVAFRRGLEGRVALANELKAKHNLVMTKLDADAGVTAADFAATCNVAAANVA